MGVDERIGSSGMGGRDCCMGVLAVIVGEAAFRSCLTVESRNDEKRDEDELGVVCDEGGSNESKNDSIVGICFQTIVGITSHAMICWRWIWGECLSS